MAHLAVELGPVRAEGLLGAQLAMECLWFLVEQSYQLVGYRHRMENCKNSRLGLVELAQLTVFVAVALGSVVGPHICRIPHSNFDSRSWNI